MNVKIFFPLFLLAAPLRADLLVYEPFNYNLADAASLNGQATNAVGLTGSYSVVNSTSSGTSGSSTYQTTGLNFGANFATSGGAAALSGTGGASATGSTNLGVSLGAVTTGTLYSSYLFNFSTLGAVSGSSLASRVNTAVNGSGGYFRAEADTGGATAQSAVVYNNTTGAASGALSAGTTYLSLSRFTRVGQTTNVTPGVADLWIFTLSDYNDWVTAGSDESLLGSYATFEATNTYQAANTSTFPFSNTRFLQFALGAAASDAQSAAVDELRYGTTLLDVTPVPEPTTGATILSGAALVALVRRRFSV